MFFRNIIFFIIALVISLIMLCFAVERLIFWTTAEIATGEVVRIGSFEQYGYVGCRSWMMPCYIAEISFEDREGERYIFEISFEARSANLTPTSPDFIYKKGNKIPVIYSPTNPNRAYQKDTFWDKFTTGLWITLITWIFAMLPGSRD